MKRAVRCFAAVLAAVCAVLFGICAHLRSVLPDEITAYSDNDIVFENYSFYHFSTVSVNNQSKNEDTGMISKNGARAAQTAFSIAAEKSGEGASHIERGEISLFHIVPIKAVTVHQAENKAVVPCGSLFGIKFYAKGAAVIRCCEVEDELSGTVRDPGNECGLRPGDTILAINGQKIDDYRDVERLTQSCGGEALELICTRGSRQFTARITPARSGGEYRLGLWVRDSAAGLGTMTFYDPQNGRFASLGHGICDDETGKLLSIDKAEITQVEIAGITKGTDGSPGSINGYFSDSSPIGLADVNSECGLYGELARPICSAAPVKIAAAHEVREGKAQILCTLDESGPKLYDIEITKVDHDEKNKTKNLQITASDTRLTEKTGGIVQGMSGCPILQNGKLVGAVTHVLITNSVKGYGIFAQNMYEEMEKGRN